MFRRAAHAHSFGKEPFAPCQRHAREDKQQQQVHDECKDRFVGQAGREVAEKYVALQRHPAETHVGDRLDPAYTDEQEPAECQRHVHITQQGVDPKDAAVQQRFADDFACSFERRACRDVTYDAHLVGARQLIEPIAPFPSQREEHRGSSDDERNAERCEETHLRNPPVYVLSAARRRVC